jgi:carbon-monoxide dehydrogenase medium subunit
VGFAELSRRHGDFALVGLAATVAMQRGRIDKARLVYFGCTDHAKVAEAVSAAITGQTIPLPDVSSFEEAIHKDLSPDDTPGLRAGTRIHLATVLTRRVLNSLSEKAAA